LLADATEAHVLHDRRMAARPRQILVGFDGSETSKRALDAAADLVGYGSCLAVVHVRRAGSPEVDAIGRAREQLIQRQVAARYLEARGHPAEEIVATAESVGADLVVVGRRKALKRVLGSVSAAVVRQAPCDVLVVR
jgi:nucleotide-binding universal stress UspA family protein